MDEKTMCIIMLVLVCISILVYLLYRIKKDGLRATVVDLIVSAEKMFKKGENIQKFEYVVDKIIKILPAPIRFFITVEAVENFVQLVFDETKKALDYREG